MDHEVSGKYGRDSPTLEDVLDKFSSEEQRKLALIGLRFLTQK